MVRMVPFTEHIYFLRSALVGPETADPFVSNRAPWLGHDAIPFENELIDVPACGHRLLNAT